jgi:hypothetical protein
LVGKVRQLDVLLVLVQTLERFNLALNLRTHLQLLQLSDGLPYALPEKQGQNAAQAPFSLAVHDRQQRGQFALHDKGGVEKIDGDEEHRHIRFAHGSFDLFFPVVAGLDLCVSPGTYQALRAQNCQMWQHILEPGGILVAVTDEKPCFAHSSAAAVLISNPGKAAVGVGWRTRIGGLGR